MAMHQAHHAHSNSSTQPWRRMVPKATIPFVVGGSAGIVATVCTQPIDILKVHMQLLGEGVKNATRPSAFSVAKNIVTGGNVLSLYQGVSAAILRQVVYGTSRLGFFFSFENALKARAERNHTQYGFRERTLAGVSAGALAATIGTPTEVVLIHMQSDSVRPPSERVNYRSIFHALSHILRHEGVRGMWRGVGPTVVRAMSTNFGQLTVFSEVKQLLEQKTSISSDRSRVVVASVFASCFAAVFCAPFDFVKTRLQRGAMAPGHGPQYRGTFDCIYQVARTEGIGRFYRGFMPLFWRSAPHTTITLVLADSLTKFLLR